MSYNEAAVRYMRTRKWRIRPARTRAGNYMPRVFEICLPDSLGVLARCMSIDHAMNRCEEIIKAVIRGDFRP